MGALHFIGDLRSIASGDEANRSAEEFFEKQVRPVLVEHCYGCHSDSGRVKGGLRLDTRAGMIAGGDSGAAIVPGDAPASLLVEAIRYQNHDLQMPPKSALPPHAIMALEQWIDDGALDPRVEVTDQRAASALVGMSVAQGRQFWSFQPVLDSPLPSVADTEQVRNPIDTFLLARLEQADMAFAPVADKATLIRRVTQDLIGLPPTIAEVDDFLADDSPAAFEHVVERLLNSPQYGVRWGRHWLDVVRYADSNGLDENLGYGQAWRYRDYVVDAFNQDKPYDQFLIEQIAGDLLPGANRETKTATGFLSLGAKVLAEPDRQKLEMDIIDEQLDTLGKAFLGMTFGCVRCHDHKFDPIKQSDYYALAAIFKSTKTLAESSQGAIKHWYEHSFASDGEAERLKQIEAQIAAKNKAATDFKNTAIATIRRDAHAKAADYLAAAAQFDVSTPLTVVAQIAAPVGLHPRILHHCRMHLDFHREDPLFATWHRYAAEHQIDAIRDHYQQLFDRSEAAFREAQAIDPAMKTLTDSQLQAARDALLDGSGFLAIPSKEAFAFDDQTLAEYYRLLEEARAFESRADDETAAMGVGEGSVVTQMPIHIRGSYKNLGEPVAREFPQVMRGSSVRPIFPVAESGRLQLANWMADTRHPLTARVMVNRIWGWHFGQPLVRTTENFGVLGDRPAHPELLDWLAMRFMESGWSIKALHRLILGSNVYQLSANHPDSQRLSTLDPENRLLWKANLKRLEAEQIRDSILAVSGQLDDTIGGKTLPLRNRQFVFNHTSEDHTRYDSVRRAIYLPVIRNHLYAFFEQFDYPDPTMPTGARNATVIAPQNLLLMNDELVIDSAAALADALLAEIPNANADDDRLRVDRVYRRALARQPTPRELERAISFVSPSTSDSSASVVEQQRQAWSLFCHSLIVSNEFIYLR